MLVRQQALDVQWWRACREFTDKESCMQDNRSIISRYNGKIFASEHQSAAVVDQACSLIEFKGALPLPYSAPKCNYCAKPAATTALKRF